MKLPVRPLCFGLGLILASPWPVAAATMQDKPRPKVAKQEKSLRERLIGTWVGRKVVTYRRDGAWLLQRYEGAKPTVGHWSLKGNLLTFTNPEAGTFTEKIKSVTQTKLIFETDDQDKEWDRIK